MAGRTLYVGATTPIALRDVARLGAGWAIQPKVDGILVHLHLNSRGRVGHVFMRRGAPAPRHLTGHLVGALLGAPHAELVGEFEAMTDAGEAAAVAGGFRRVHLFDCLHNGSRSLVREPYAARRDALWRLQSAVQCAAPDDDPRPAPWRRYRDPVPPGWKLAPIVPQVAAGRASWAWEEWVKAVDGEGLVVVALGARAGARASKRKVKPWETLDCVVHEVGQRRVTCLWNGHPFTVYRGKHYVEPGNVVEVSHAGWYQRGVTPKFPRLIRVRRDLLT